MMSREIMITENSVICLMAPTASGKTALAYELYDTGRYELISVDSALIYRDMDIGTAKPTCEELSRYPHHLVNIIDPTESYSVAEFVRDIECLIDDIHHRGKIPLLVGGTMMYFMALLDGISNVPDSDPVVRLEVEQWRQSEGINALHHYLASVDPQAYHRLNPSDTQRITRAVEVFKQTGRALSEWQSEPKQALAHRPDQQWLAFAVMPDRQWLHQRIEQRLDIMWQQGLIDEVIGLLQRYPLTPDMPSMRSVGYRQVLEYLVKTAHPVFDHSHLNKNAFYKEFLKDLMEVSTANTEANILPKLHTAAQKQPCLDMQNKALYATRQLAKRQYTWLRKITSLYSTNDDNSTTIQRQPINNSQPVIYSFNSIEKVKSCLK